MTRPNFNPWVIIEHMAPPGDVSPPVRALAQVIDTEKTQVCCGDHYYVARRTSLHGIFKFVRRLTHDENEIFIAIRHNDPRRSPLGAIDDSTCARLVYRALQQSGALRR